MESLLVKDFVFFGRTLPGAALSAGRFCLAVAPEAFCPDGLDVPADPPCPGALDGNEDCTGRPDDLSACVAFVLPVALALVPPFVDFGPVVGAALD